MIKFMGFLMMGSLLAASCGDDDEPTPDPDPEGPARPMAMLNFEGEYWKGLIDGSQYGGPLIYSADEYKWEDKATGLRSEVVKEDWTEWGGGFGWGHGIAISNYVNPEASLYTEQLAVPAATGNFAVAFDNNSMLSFADGKDHEFVSVDLSPTSYGRNTMTDECGKGYEFKVILTFTRADGTSVTKDIALAKGEDVQKGFKTFDLGVTATSMNITFDGTNTNEYGLLTPKYVAIDNVAVRK